MDGYYSDTDLVSLYLNNPGLKISEITTITGRSVPEFYRILKRSGISPNRLKTNQHLVLSYHNAGYNIPQIAELTGYTTRNVRYIISNRDIQRGFC